jgi:hypothetical protein
MAGGLTGILWIQTPYNAPFTWAARWLSIPIFLLAGLFVYSGWGFYRRTMAMTSRIIIFVALTVPALILLFAAGYVSIINAAFPTERSVVFSGTVKSIWTPPRDFEDLRVTVTLDPMGGEQKFYVRRSLQPTVRIGAPFKVRMVIGCLGFPFEPVWPFGADKRASNENQIRESKALHPPRG